MERRCQFWLPKKSRFCANAALNNTLYCGNHIPRLDLQWVPCPIDLSHSVLQHNLEGHLKRCPLLKQTQSLESQSFYRKGINAGNEDEYEHEPEDRLALSSVQQSALPEKRSSTVSNCVSSEMKRNAVYSLPVPEFHKLISKIKAIHSSICNDIRYSYRIPDVCSLWIKREIDGKLPFQEKHVTQQASILGNLQDFGVLNSSAERDEHDSKGLADLDDNNIHAVVEFGAGRGYLTQMLADCYGITKAILVERKSYKLKADRSLRQKKRLMLERLRIDIEDLNLNAVDSLWGVPFLAIGKHLCGPATDLTLRCCLTKPCYQGNEMKQAATTCLRGLAVATCCHHLCQWKHYINKKFLLNLGITKECFHAITWFTSWAVDADHSSDICDIMDSGLELQSIKEESNGEATCVEEIIRKMKPTERAALGLMCKEIIDVGRLLWVEQCGLKTQLVKYVPPTVSPENRLLIAMHGNA